MRKILCLLLLLAFSLSAHAQTPALDQLNISCTQSLCGESYPLLHPFQLDRNAEATTSRLIEINLKRDIEVYMGRLIHKSVLLNQAYKVFDNYKGDIKISIERQGLLQSLRALKKISNYLITAKQDQASQFTFDKDHITKILGNPSADELEAYQTLEGLFNISMTLGQLVEYYSYELLLKSLYPNLSLSEAQVNEAIAIEDANKEMGQLVPLLAAANSSDIIVKHASQGSPLSASEKYYMKKQIQSRIMMSFLLTPSIQEAFQKLPLNQAEILAEARAAYKASPIGQSMQTPQTIKRQLQDGVSNCAGKLAYSYAALPTQVQIDTFLSQFQNLEATVQQIVEEKIKSSLPKKMDIQVLAPPARETLISDWKTYFQDATKEEEEALETLKVTDLKSSNNLDSLLIAYYETSTEDLLSPVNAFCEQARPPFLNDSAFSSGDMITISWPTIVHPALGMGIVAHELGHMVSAKWPEAVKKEKDCLTEKQGTNQYMEEDFADIFSAEVTNRLGGKMDQINLTNFACAIILPNQFGWPVGDLNNPVERDSHSSGFFRLIVNSTLTGHLSNQCSQFLSAVKEDRFADYCQWQK